MKVKFLGILMVLGSPLLLSCGGGLSRSGSFSAGNQSIIASQFVATLAQTRFNAAPTLPAQGIPAGVTTSSIRTMAVDSCITESPTTAVDADGDGIAVTKNYKFDCSSVTSGTDKWSYAGSLDVKDYDDTLKWIRGGYKFTYDSLSSFTLTAGAKGSYGYKGFWEGTASGSSHLFKSDFTMAIKTEASTYPATDYILRSQWKMTLTPEVETTPWSKGTLKSSGFYHFSGTYLDESPAGGHKAVTGTTTLEVSSTDLVYNTTCSEYYESGSWWLVDGSGNKMEIRYTCTARKGYMNGTEFTF